VPGPIEGRSRIKVLPETVMDNAGVDYDVIFLPGGAVGTENLKKNQFVKAAVEELMRRSKLVTAICAAPTVLSAIGVTRGRTVTSHPSVRHELKNEILSDERVVMDGNIITSQGPGTAMEFAFRLVEAIFGKRKVEEVNKGVLAKI